MPAMDGQWRTLRIVSVRLFLDYLEYTVSLYIYIYIYIHTYLCACVCVCVSVCVCVLHFTMPYHGNNGIEVRNTTPLKELKLAK